MQRASTEQRTSVKQRIAAGLLTVLTAASLSACEPKVALRGNTPLESKMEQVRVGQSTKRDVVSLIGSPSTVGTFDDNVWYYMSQTKETWAFLDPEVTENQILAFHFDDQGVLSNIENFDKTALQDVTYSDKKTPTSGRTMSIVEQLFGNLGRFGS